MSTDEPYIDPASGDRRMLIAGLVLGFLGIIAVGIIIFWTLRLRVPQSYTLEDPPPTSTSTPSSSAAVQRHVSTKANLKRKATGRLLDRNHIAAKITPFGHDPNADARTGENMRIATRLPNGAWQFGEPSRGSLTVDRVEQEGRRASADLLRNGYGYGLGLGGGGGGSLTPGFGLPPSSPSVESYHTNHSNNSQVPLLGGDIPDSRLTHNLDPHNHDREEGSTTSHTHTYKSKHEEAAASKWMEEPEYVEPPPPAYGMSPAYDAGGYGYGTGYGNQNQYSGDPERDRWR